MESSKPLTNRDLELFNMDLEGYDCVQIVLSRIVGMNHGHERQTVKSAHVYIADLREAQASEVVPEPLLTGIIETANRTGEDPMQFVRFIGEVAVRI